jgi:hypothetical protein
MRCPVYKLESIGKDLGWICRRSIAEREGIPCQRDPSFAWKPCKGCHNVEHMKKNRATTKLNRAGEAIKKSEEQLNV